MNVLQRKVFVLNKNWKLISESPVQDVLVQMATDVVTALDFQPDGNIRPVKWDEWITLPLRNEEEVVRTSKLNVRMPTVVVTCKYAKVPKRKTKFTLKNLAYTHDNRCAYTGELLAPGEWSKDHVVPLSRGGLDVPENVVLAGKKTNNKKSNKLPHEAGLPKPKVLKLKAPPLKPTHPDHRLFSQ